MPPRKLRVVSSKIPMPLFVQLVADANKRGVTPSRRVNEILTAYYKRYTMNGRKPNGSKKIK